MNKVWIKIASFIFIVAFVVVFNYGGCGGSGDSGGGSISDSGSSSLGPISITTNPATNIVQSSAILNGTVNPNGADTNVYFEYGLTLSYGSNTGYQFIGSGTSAINVSVNLTGLAANTAYNFRIKATRNGITYNGANQTFITAGTPPTCVTNPATNITYNSARLYGSVIPNGIATSAYFQYGLTTSYTVTTTSLAVGSGTNIVLINTDIGGLTENTQYNFRIVATSFAGITYGTNRTFTTTAPPVPTCVTKPATNITTNSATLNGTVNPNGISTNAFFNHGSTTSYENTTTSQSIGSGAISLTVSANISGLTSNSVYNFRVSGTNSFGTTYGDNLTLTTGNTSGSAPTCITDPADNISYGSARLNGTVIPNGLDTYVYFEYGLNTSYSVTTDSQFISNGTTSVAVSYTATGLSTNTLYNFRVAATSTAGTSLGGNLTFTTTPAPPTCVINTADNITCISARLNGTVNPNGLATTAYFEWGLSTSYGNNTDLQLLGSGTSDVIINAAITGFSENRTYFFRLRATNSAGETITKYQTFGNWFETTFTTGTFLNTASTTGAADVTLSRIDYGTGTDGSVTVAGTFNLNVANNQANVTKSQTRTPADGWNSRVSALGTNTATLVTTIPTNTFAVGDEVILINLKGISTVYPNVGNYEFLRVLSVTTSSPWIVTFTANKVNWYGDGANDTNLGNTTSNQFVVLQRVPNYTNVTINTSGSIICNTWNGTTTFGVIAFRANGTVQVNVANGINATGLGFLGGVGGQAYNVVAVGGESYNGTGGSGGTYNAVGNVGQGGGGGGGANIATSVFNGGAAAIGNGGGGGGGAYGGSSFYTTYIYFCNSGGGGGGGNGSAGNGGGYPASSSSNGATGSVSSGGAGGNGTWNNIFCYSNAGGGGGGGSDGRTDSSTLNQRAYMGGGGGASGGGYQLDGYSVTGGAGGPGGGIIFIGANVLNIASAASVVANGNAGAVGAVGGYSNNYDIYRGGGGGGAGGSVILFANSISNLGSVSAIGGNGGGNPGPNTYLLYNGGAGGGGRTYARYVSFSGTVPFSSTNYSGLVATTDTSLPCIISGTYTSTVIAPAGVTSWGILTFTNTLPTNTTFTVDVLDSSDNLLVTAVPSGTDLSNNYPTSLTGVTGIRLRSNFSTINTSATPILSEWGVGYSNFYSPSNGAPVVETTAATYTSTYTSAFVNGIVNPNGLATNASFQWGLSSSYGFTTTVQSLVGSSNVVISDTITGLSANVPYYFRISATNSAGTTVGVNRTLGNWLETTFTTGTFSSCAPTATGATDIALARINSGNGADGPLIVLSNSFNINVVTNGFNGRTAPDGVLWQINLSVASGQLTISSGVAIPTPGFAVGDEIMIIRIKGATGDQLAAIGQYEVKRITWLSTSSMTVDSNLSYAYDGTGNGRVQVQRIPNYTDVTINTGGSIICTGWNGTTGGVIAFRASGTLQVNVANGINATGSGFRGGTGVAYGSNAPGGESYNGTGGSGGTYAANGNAGQGGGGGGGVNAGTTYTGGAGAAGSGGGGGGALYYTAFTNYRLGGSGGGGGHASVGVDGIGGTNGTPDPSGTIGGTGGTSTSASPFTGGHGGGGGNDGWGTSNGLNTRAYLGGGGGAGGGITVGGGAANVSSAYGANGGNGGGIIFIGANILNIASGASIISNGTAGVNSSPVPAGTAGANAHYSNNGPGGGGAGGSIIIYANQISNLGTTSSIDASAGSGGLCRNVSYAYNGGAGSAGRLYVQYGGTFASKPTVNFADVPATYTTTTIGTYTSAIIAPVSVSSWGALTYTSTLPTGTTFTVDVLNSSDSVLITGVSSGTNLATYPALNGVTSIKLRANFSTTDTAATPTLADWVLSYEGP
ncbi:MAG: hypothetical protein V1871_07885 [Planctomycetota bacterium]